MSRVDIYDKDTDEVGSILQFTWDGDRLVSRTAVDPTGSYAITSKIIYDTDGESIGFCVDTNINPADCPEEKIGVPLGVYFYEKNLQGDVVKVIHGATGTVLANFSYDAYGNLEVHADDIGEVIGAILVLAFTPQLYRGYIYVPLGDNLCYYLGSRFYNPQLGRFLNADKHTDTGTGVNGTNMFAYCNNNPVIFIDPTGEIPTVFVQLRKFLIKISNFLQKIFSVSGGSSKPSCVWPTGRVHIVDDYPYYKSGGKHSGTDIQGSAGDPIYAAMSGTVEYCVQCYENWQNSGNTSAMKSGTPSWGNYVGIRLDKDSSVVIYYAHQQKNNVVSKGQHVDAGDLIGYIGNTGNSYGAHLHFQVKKNGSNVNPADYLPK